MANVYAFFGGSTEFYALVFTITATVLAFMSLLKAEYVAAIGAIQVLITANDVHNDINVKTVTNVNVNPGGSQ
jgi:hypothetical protein